MSAALDILQGGPSLSIQDMGRRGYRAVGLTEAGAMDPEALHEGAALLHQSPDFAAIEMAGSGGSFRATADIRIALTGATMAASLDGEALTWNASHAMPAGATLTIGGARRGSYGYLHIGGGIATDPVMGSRSSHLRAGVGQTLETEDTLPIGPDVHTEVSNGLTPSDRFDGGKVRIVASMQTEAFDQDTRDRFTATTFRRDPRGNRMGVRMDSEGAGFSTGSGLSIVSEIVVAGDIQITGDGAPFVLMCECQTTGGYPRIGTVIPCDLPRIAQAQPGTAIRFEFITMAQAIALGQRHAADMAGLRSRVAPLIRDPATIRDLLSYTLISGVISATTNPFEE
ncbi:biotin-dependent carboxyltransferase family protein [uncultured Sulfitobacter sp.]|uniref:5-oxoprolinase subunit C family protein n=1 Tax=uncultured Sulfitobacter sp. TaxID=191468 RepID=UPI00262A8B04|nr:biotin-dependent carboxyltransferase family protein [uncultured Sulfitobacter sp.]